MGETLLTANELQAYTIADRGTWLSMRERLTALDLLFGGATVGENPDSSLRNPYGVIPVSQARHPTVAAELAEEFVAWLLSDETQARIGEFGREQYGQPLFYPQASDE
jgi:tungstate transport system substrate-binding protein